MQRHHATVSIVDAFTKNPEEITREADILVSDVGVPNLVRGHWLKPGAVVIDMGCTLVTVGFVETTFVALPFFNYSNNARKGEFFNLSIMPFHRLFPCFFWMKTLCFTYVLDNTQDSRGSCVTGDVCYEEAKLKASLITPVPGGVGPVTISMLLYNTVEAAKRAYQWT